jgi:hypothetical protein
VEIVDYLIKALEFGDSWKNTDVFIREEILRKPHGLLLWDGLDEVHSRELLNKVVSTIRYLSSAFPNCSQIVACRTAAYQNYLPFFKEIEIAPFDPGQISEFVCKWFIGDPAKDGIYRPPAGTAQTESDTYTRYELLEPGSGKFKIYYEVTATTAGAKYYYNPIRKGSVATDESVYDAATGKPLHFEVVSGADAHKDPLIAYRGGLGGPFVSRKKISNSNQIDPTAAKMKQRMARPG